MPPLIEFKHAYANLIGQTYGTLNAKEKQAVYAMEIYDDSGDALIACDIFNATDLSPEFVDGQNRDTFEYTDDTVIKGNVLVNMTWNLLQTYDRIVKGQPFHRLKERDKRILYAYKLQQAEGNHPETALIFVIARDMRYIGYQLRNTYGYEDGTIC